MSLRARPGFPRITEIINVDKIPKASAQGAEEVLKMIAFRMSNTLEGLWAISEHWNEFDRKWHIYDPNVHPIALKLGKSGRPLLEEQWARGISELLMGTAYDGPDQESGLAIQDIYKSFCEDPLPFCAICCACQWWVFFSPNGELAKKLLADSSRGKTLADFEKEATITFSKPLLVVRSLIGAIPKWMDDVLKVVGPHTVYNPGQVAIPGALDDKG